MNNLPEGWHEVSIETYIDCLKQEGDKSYFETNLDRLCILSESDEWEDMSSSKVLKTIRDNQWITEYPKNIKPKSTIDIYSPKSFSSLTLAEWLDLENFIINKEYNKVLGLLYRQTKENEWGHTEVEPYKYQVLERYENLRAYNCLDIVGIFNEVYMYREKVLSSYNDLFSPSIDDNEEELTEEETEGLSPQEILEIEKEIADDKLKQDYIWSKLISDIGDGDWSKSPRILELPHLFVFNMMRMKRIFKE